MRRVCVIACLFAALGMAEDNRSFSLGDRARQYLVDLIRLDTINPPGNESKVAIYLKDVADSQGIPNELIGSDPKRLNFIARLRGSGKSRPLLMLAHSDVFPIDRMQWAVDPFSAELRNGFIYGRGSRDDKALLAAELAVMVELKRRNIRLNRDLILLSEADEEEGSSGIQWVIQHAWPKIDCEFAINEGGAILEAKDGERLFEIQTTEKIPTRVVLTARGTATRGTVPRDDNPIIKLSRAVIKLSESEQPAHLQPTVRRYFRELAKLPEYAWLAPLLTRLENPATLPAAANQVRMHDPDLDSLLRTTVSPTVVQAGAKINLIPNKAEAQVDVRRLPGETREDVLDRIRQIINDPSIEMEPVPAPQVPFTDPSSVLTPLYKAMERAINRVYPRDTISPYMSRATTDAPFLRIRGVAVYGVPLFTRDPGENVAHGPDEKISPKNVEDGVGLLWQMVLETGGNGV